MFQRLLEFISEKFRASSGPMGYELWCEDHDEIARYGERKPDETEMMSAIGKHIDEDHPEVLEKIREQVTRK